MKKHALLLFAIIAVPLAPTVGGQFGLASTEWAEGPLDTTGVPQGRHYRVHLLADVPGPLQGTADLPVTVSLDMAEILSDAGYPSEQGADGLQLQGFQLDIDSFALYEVDDSGAILEGGERLPLLVSEGSLSGGTDFDPARSPVVTLRWLLQGVTNGARHFVLYFDALHNRPTEPVQHSPEALSTLAATVGPGRGTRLYVPLYNVDTIEGPGEERRIRITSLAGPTEVRIHEYTQQGLPEAQPSTTLQLSSQGDVEEYIFGRGGQARSTGTLLVEADLPVTVEALSVKPSERDGFDPNAFLPALEGGFLGASFGAAPHHDETWSALCPAVLLPADQSHCSISFDDGPPVDVLKNTHVELDATGQAWHTVDYVTGAGLVQRSGTGLTPWPASDGPGQGRNFMALAGDSDVLLVHSDDPGPTCILVNSASGTLADKGINRECIQQGQWADGSRSWGALWSRPWPTGAEHVAGVARIEAFDGDGALQVVSGTDPLSEAFGVLAPLQSGDAGYTYRFEVPATNAGTALGKLSLFAPYPETIVQTNVVDVPPLQQHQRYDLAEPGDYQITSNQPIVVSWTQFGLGNSFAGWAGGITEAATISVVEAQIADYVLDIEMLDNAVQQRRPGDVVEFDFRVHNLGQAADGGGLSDTVHLEVDVPPGWGSAQVAPNDFSLGARASRDATVSVRVPQDADIEEGGATLRLTAESEGNPNLEVSQSLRINYIAKRGVRVLAEGDDVIHEGPILDGNGTATYLVQVRNDGSINDQYRIEVSPPTSQWVQSFKTLSNGDENGTAILQAGEEAQYELRLAPVKSASARLVTNILATSVNDFSVSDSVRIQTAVGANRSLRIAVDDPIQVVEPGQNGSFRIVVHNDAETNENLNVKLTPLLPDGWMAPDGFWLDDGRRIALANVSNLLSIPALSSATLLVEQAVPPEADPLVLGEVRLRLLRGSSAEDAPETGLRVLAKQTRGVQMELDPPVATVAPDAELDFELAMTSLGNDNQSFQVQPILPERWGLLRSGDPPPWNVSLAPGGTESLTLRLQVPAGALAGSQPVHLQVSSPGADTLAASLGVSVPALPQAMAQNRSVSLGAGQTVLVPWLIANVGNIPLDLQPTLVDAPGWTGQLETITIPVAQQRELDLLLTAPGDFFGVRQLPVRLMHGSQVAGEATMRIVAPVDPLQLRLVAVEEIPGAFVQRWRVENQADLPVGNVSLELRAGDRFLDRFTFSQILAGESGNATLLGNALPRETRLILTSDQAPAGQEILVADEPLLGASVDTPAPFVLAALLALLAVADHRRRRR